MTNSPVTVTYSLEEILGEINKKLEKLQEDVSDIKVEQATMKGDIKGDIKALDVKLTGEIKTLDTKVDGIGKRLDNQEFVSRGILVALIVAILGGLAKLFGVVGNPT